MKLHAMHLIHAVPHGHDRAVFLRAGRHLEIVWHAVGGDHQRVIPAGEKWLIDPGKHPFAIVHDGGRLAVHRRVGTRHDAAVDHADGLMTETDAEQRRPRTESLDHVRRDAGILGTTGPGRDHDLIRGHHLDLAERHLIVAAHAHLRAELAEVLHEVVGKRIVVVDDEHHYNPACASSSARITAFALSRVSSYSAAGFESATMPAPAWT